MSQHRAEPPVKTGISSLKANPFPCADDHVAARRVATGRWPNGAQRLWGRRGCVVEENAAPIWRDGALVRKPKSCIQACNGTFGEFAAKNEITRSLLPVLGEGPRRLATGLLNRKWRWLDDCLVLKATTELTSAALTHLASGSAFRRNHRGLFRVASYGRSESYE